MNRQGEGSVDTRATAGRRPRLFQGILMAALLGLGMAFGHLLTSRDRAPLAAPAARDSDEAAQDSSRDRLGDHTAATAPSGSRPSRRRAPAPAAAPAAIADNAPGAESAGTGKGALAADTDDGENQAKSLPAVDGLLGQLKERARSRHDVTVDEIDPGVRAIHQLYGQMSPDEVLQKEGQFTREMAELSRQFRAERARASNQSTGGTE